MGLSYMGPGELRQEVARDSCMLSTELQGPGAADTGSLATAIQAYVGQIGEI